MKVLTKNTSKLFWCFCAFLAIGFLADLGVLVAKNIGLDDSEMQAVGDIYTKYPIIEAMFFFWLIGQSTNSQKLKLYTKWAIFLTLPLWLILENFLGPIVFLGAESFNIFPALYRIVCTFMSAYAVLHLAENEFQIRNMSGFWFVTAILVYCLPTFIILLISNTPIAEQLWFMHNVPNIAAYIIFSIGFHKVMKYESITNKVT
ncbi:hypothetical protein [Roseivirga sp. E12]|uniref:hypothetical protein n=1 Tax=Roseivirga sp. E12 TaxID=2819237 RepID=UPI001ABC267A|nr:hypothetical protein [Roseivirga sp. E12]